MSQSIVNARLDRLAAEWDTICGSVSHDLRPVEAELLDADPKDRFLRVATGGWSDNEALFAAWRFSEDIDDRIAWGMCWRMSVRGGLHIFQYLPG